MRISLIRRLAKLEASSKANDQEVTASTLVRWHLFSKTLPERLTKAELDNLKSVTWKDLQAAYKIVWEAARSEDAGKDFDSVLIYSVKTAETVG